MLPGNKLRHFVDNRSSFSYDHVAACQRVGAHEAALEIILLEPMQAEFLVKPIVMAPVGEFKRSDRSPNIRVILCSYFCVS